MNYTILKDNYNFTLKIAISEPLMQSKFLPQILIGESSKYAKSWTLENQISKHAVFQQNINNFKFKWSFVL